MRLNYLNENKDYIKILHFTWIHIQLTHNLRKMLLMDVIEETSQTHVLYEHQTHLVYVFVISVYITQKNVITSDLLN